MIHGRSVLGIIPARGGSKGIPRKNVRLVGGKPLIAWTIEAGRLSRYIDRLIVSSEDREILDTAVKWGCEAPFVRPADLARDETPGIAPVWHALEQLPGYDIVVLLQPTSPLRQASDIDGCIERFHEGNATVCVSVSVAHPNPLLIHRLSANETLIPLLSSEERSVRRQEMPTYYYVNGAVYVASVGWVQEGRNFFSAEPLAFLMPPERAVDIDSDFDLMIANCLLSGAST